MQLRITNADHTKKAVIGIFPAKAVIVPANGSKIVQVDDGYDLTKIKERYALLGLTFAAVEAEPAAAEPATPVVTQAAPAPATAPKKAPVSAPAAPAPTPAPAGADKAPTAPVQEPTAPVSPEAPAGPAAWQVGLVK